ncbi:ATP-binding protein [Paucibacter sp. APW11]|uniref:histidine kinase n=1 Tax=Roseateles aquae TaxID=3077235 RepID=A0ABU3PI82_9BURK|nr:ATP-binding protein [Paucibacter sp. APW11]MDT9001711.1 ATP-binding protein [Paucibacter sp. APW11]
MRLRALLPQSLVARVFLLYSAAMLLFFGLGFGAFVYYTATSSIEEAGDEINTMSSMVSPAVAESAVIGDYDTIKRLIERAIEHPALRGGAFIDLKGGRISAERQQPPGLAAPAWLHQLVLNRLDDVNTTIAVGGKDYGVLRFTLWTERIAADIWRQALIALSLALLSLLSGVVLVWFPLKRWLGNLGRIQAFGEQIQMAGGRLSHVEDVNAPLEFRQTFEILNRAAASLQVERAQAAVTLAAIADGVATTNSEGVVVLANPVLARWLGKPASELLGQPIQQLLPNMVEPALHAEVPRLRLDGPEGPRVLELSRSAIEGEDGAPAGWVLALRDVSEQHRLEAQLRQELSARSVAMRSMRDLLEEFQRRDASAVEGVHLAQEAGRLSDIEALSSMIANLVHQLGAQSAQLSAIFALSPDGFVSFDARGQIDYISPAFERLTGIHAEQALGWQEAELGRALRQRCAEDGASFSIAALSEGKRNLSLQQPLPRVLEFALHRGSGQQVSQVLHVRDMTHQIEVDRMKSEFLTTAAHELRTPMTSIYGFTELMLLRPMSAERMREGLSKVHRQSEAMMSILNELLDISRLEARRGKDFVFERLDPRPLIEEAVSDFKPPEGREAPILELRPAGELIHVDRGKLLQVLRNLLSNAYKYSPDGGPVWVRMRSSGEPAALLQIEVEDRGMGMDAEQLSHVTERFYRADKSGHIPGTGLGMSIVKEIIELLGGSLQLRSALGQGTTVTLQLPLAREAQALASSDIDA